MFQRDKEALEVMEKAILADERNPLPLYEKAKILVSLEKFDEALEVLDELKEYAPRESCIYAMIGKIYEKQKIYDAAILHFGLAIDLNPNALDVAAVKVINHLPFLLVFPNRLQFLVVISSIFTDLQAAMENLLVHCQNRENL